MDYNAQLIEAAKARKEDNRRVLRLIQSGANVNAKDERSETPLHWAACAGNYVIAKTLLEHGAQINAGTNDANWTPLAVAIFRNHYKVVRLLLERGANPNAKAGSSRTALEYAITQNTNATIVGLLIEHGADVNAVVEKKTPLHWACEVGNKKLVELLIDKGANLEARDENDQKPVDLAKKNNFLEIVDMLEKNFPLWLRLYHASKQGNYEECKAVLERGALVGFPENGLYCPVAAASKKGHFQIVQLLLAKGARISYKDAEKKKPLYLATKHNHKDIVSLLWDAGGRGHVIKVNGETLLHVAVKNNNEEMVRLIIEKEVNPNIKDNVGCTPLHYATFNGNHAIVTCLLNASANVNLANNKMETPLHLACEGGHTDIVQLLLENGANKEALNDQKEKPVNVVDKRKSETEKTLVNLNNIKEVLNPWADNLTQSGIAASSERFSDHGDHSSDIESNADVSGEDSDSDATVDYPDSKKTPMKADFSCGTLTIVDIEELNGKMAQLSSLILELNEHAMNAELIETDFAFEADTLKHLDFKMEQVRGLKRLKSQDSKAQMVYEDKIVDLTRRMDESKKKEAELREQIEKLHTEIPQLKARVKSVFREIARFIKKIHIT